MVSNKSLAVLIVLAVVLSLGAQIFSISKISRLQSSTLMPVTGFATSGTGRIQLNISQSTDISVYNSSLDFGNGVVNQTGQTNCAFANLSTHQSGVNENYCWANQTWTGAGSNSPGTLDSKKILIQNDGNLNVSITLTSAQKNASNFIGNCSRQPHNWYMFAGIIGPGNSSEGCPGTNLKNWTNFTGEAQPICEELDWQANKDTIGIVFNLSICESLLELGFKNDNITVTSAAA